LVSRNTHPAAIPSSADASGPEVAPVLFYLKQCVS
jgi:hypothetical protein